MESHQVADFCGAVGEFTTGIYRLEALMQQFTTNVTKLQNIEAMKAENAMRENQGLSPAYGEAAFWNA